MKDYETPMISGCKKEHNKLHVVLALLQMKASNGWSNKDFNELLHFEKFAFKSQRVALKHVPS
jgi:hypothetical protein